MTDRNSRAHQYARLWAVLGDRWGEVIPVDARPVHNVDGEKCDAFLIDNSIVYRRSGTDTWIVRVDGIDDVGYRPKPGPTERS